MFRRGPTPLFSLNQHFVLGDHTSISSRGDDERLASLYLRLLLLFLYQFSCLLINARRYIHFGFHIITSYLVSVPLFKGDRGVLHNCSSIIQIYLFWDKYICLETPPPPLPIDDKIGFSTCHTMKLPLLFLVAFAVWELVHSFLNDILYWRDSLYFKSEFSAPLLSLLSPCIVVVASSHVSHVTA